jgi:hypothetical protein
MRITAVPGKKSTILGRCQGSRGHTNTGKIANNIKLSNSLII